MLTIARGKGDADVTVIATAEAVAGVVHGRAPLDTLAVEGHAKAVEHFVTLFALPAKAVPT